MDENLAARAPTDRGSPKQILSHLCGPEDVGHLPILRAFVDSDTPMIDLDIGNPFFTENLARKSVGELVAECEMNYRQIADFAAELTEKQLARKAHIPKMNGSNGNTFTTISEEGHVRHRLSRGTNTSIYS